MDYTADFARYYATLNTHKDYRKEVQILRRALNDSGVPSSGRILSVGCGIGSHERLLVEYFSCVVGIDQSDEMISIGLRENVHPNLELKCQSLSQLNIQYFDAAISLFNVVNCIEAIDDVKDMFSEISKRLRFNGAFIFEIWSNQAVQEDPPVVVTRECKKGAISLLRKASPVQHSDRHLELAYEVTGVDDGHVVAFRSNHHLYLHTVEECNDALKACGYDDVKWYSALSEGMHPVKNNDRMLLCVARRHK